MGPFVRLRKIVSSHAELRTDEITGTLITDLTVGERFIIISDPLDKSLDPNTHERRVTSSPIKFVRKMSANILQIKTTNSVYELEIFPDSDKQVVS